MANETGSSSGKIDPPTLLKFSSGRSVFSNSSAFTLPSLDTTDKLFTAMDTYKLTTALIASDPMGPGEIAGALLLVRPYLPNPFYTTYYDGGIQRTVPTMLGVVATFYVAYLNMQLASMKLPSVPTLTNELSNSILDALDKTKGLLDATKEFAESENWKEGLFRALILTGRTALAGDSANNLGRNIPLPKQRDDGDDNPSPSYQAPQMPSAEFFRGNDPSENSQSMKSPGLENDADFDA